MSQADVDRAVATFQAGERREESFRFLFETYYRRIQGYFRRRTRSAEDCVDLTQETFFRVYKGLEGFRGEAPFGAWLFSIAGNVLGQHRARRKAAQARELPAVGDGPAPSSDAPLAPVAELVEAPKALDAVLEEEHRRLLRQAVERLPEQRRRCIVLWAYRGLTYEQIAMALQLALGTVKAHLAQARRQLEALAREELEAARDEEVSKR